MASKTLVIWILFKMKNGARAVGKSSNIISPPLQKGDPEKICDQLECWIKEKKEVTVRAAVADKTEGTKTQDLNLLVTLIGYSDLKNDMEALSEKLANKEQERLQQVQQPVAKKSRRRLMYTKEPSMEMDGLTNLINERQEQSLSMLDEDLDMFVANQPMLSQEDTCRSKLTPLEKMNQYSGFEEETFVQKQLGSTNQVSGVQESHDDHVRDNVLPQSLNNELCLPEKNTSANLETCKQKIMELEGDVDYLQSEVQEKDKKIIELEEELKKLRESNPEERLVERILSTVANKLEQASVGGIDSAVGSPRASSIQNNSGTRLESTPQKNMIFLIEGYPLKIDKNDLKIAVGVGNKADTTSSLNGMVNKLLEALYSRKYMSEHSLTGRSPRISKKRYPGLQTSTEDPPVTKIKPGLPPDDVNAIILFVTACWKKWWNRKIESKLIRMAITSKLSTEDRGHQKTDVPNDDQLLDLLGEKE